MTLLSKWLVVSLVALSAIGLVACGGNHDSAASETETSLHGDVHGNPANGPDARGHDEPEPERADDGSRKTEPEPAMKTSETATADTDRELASIAADGSPPVIEFESTFHDFGRHYTTERLSTTFEFKNTGGSDLVIHRLTPNCTSCTVAEYTDEAVPPGGTGTITVELKADDTGKRRKWIDVHTNCPDSPLRLTVEAVFRQFFWVEPSNNVALGKIKQGEAFPPKSVTVTWLAERDIEILEIESSSDALVFETEPIEEKLKKGIRIDARITDPNELLAQTGQAFVHATLTIKTSLPDLGPQVVRFSGHIQEEVVTHPKMLGAPAGSTDAIKIRLGGPPRSTLNLDRVECKPDVFDVETTFEDKGGPVYIITLTPRKPLEPGKGEVLLHTDFAKRPIFRLPLEIRE